MSIPTLTETRDAILSKRTNSRECLGQCLARIERLEPRLHALISYDGDRAMAAAQAIDDRIARGEAVGELAGVPVILKDNMCTSWGRTTCASKILGELPGAVQRSRRRAPAGGRRGHRGQSESRRVRDGIEHGEQRVRRDTESVEYRLRSRRQFRRLRGGGRVGHGLREPGFGHGGIDPPAGVVLRRYRAEADVRAGVALRASWRTGAAWTRSGRSPGPLETWPLYSRCWRAGIGATRPV